MNEHKEVSGLAFVLTVDILGSRWIDATMTQDTTALVQMLSNSTRLVEMLVPAGLVL